VVKTEPGVPEAVYEGQKKAKPSLDNSDEKAQKSASQADERASDLKTENDKLKAKLFKLKTEVKSAKKYKKKYKKAKKEIKKKKKELVDENKTLKTRVAELEDETEDEDDGGDEDEKYASLAKQYDESKSRVASLESKLDEQAQLMLQLGGEDADPEYVQELREEKAALEERLAELEEQTDDENDPDRVPRSLRSAVLTGNNLLLSDRIEQLAGDNIGLQTELAEVKEVRDDTFAAYVRARKDNKLLSGMYTWREWVVPEQKRQLIELETELAEVKEVRDDTFAELMRAKKDNKRLTEQNGEWKARMFFAEEDNKQYKPRLAETIRDRDAYRACNERLVSASESRYNQVATLKEKKTDLENQLIEAAKFRTQIGYEKDDAKAVLQTQLERVQMDMALVSEKLSTAMTDIAPLKKKLRDYGWSVSSQKYEIRDLKEELSEAKKKLIDLRNEAEDAVSGVEDKLDDSKVVIKGLQATITKLENELTEAAKFRTTLCNEKDDKITDLQTQLNERVQVDLTRVSESAQLATAMSDVKDHQATIRTLTKMIAGSSK